MTAAPPSSVELPPSHSITLVGAQQERLRDRELERLGGLEVDEQLELARLLHRQLVRLVAPCFPATQM